MDLRSPLREKYRQTLLRDAEGFGISKTGWMLCWLVSLTIQLGDTPALGFIAASHLKFCNYLHALLRSAFAIWRLFWKSLIRAIEFKSGVGSRFGFVWLRDMGPVVRSLEGGT